MREVAVTEGDKTEAQRRFGFSVNGYGVSDLAGAVREVADADAERTAREYDDAYDMAPALRPSGERRAELLEAARIEVALRAFLEAGGFGAFTDTFEDLDGLRQLPGIGVQRLMADGYGFGAEGDWKSAALVRILKVMGAGLDGGTSFMEDYTYHFGTRRGARPRCAHAGDLSVHHARSTVVRDPSVVHRRQARPRPPRLQREHGPGRHPRPPRPRRSVPPRAQRGRRRPAGAGPPAAPRRTRHLGATAGPDHGRRGLAVSRAVRTIRRSASPSSKAHVSAFAQIAGVELVAIGPGTTVPEVERELRWNDVHYRLANGL